jgi:hypothetical protein
VNASVYKYKLPETVEEIIKRANLESTTLMSTLQVAQSPFDKGGLRLAYYGRRLFLGKEETSEGAKVMEVKDVPHGSPNSYSASEEVVLKEFLTLLTAHTPADLEKIESYRSVHVRAARVRVCRKRCI